MEVSGKFRMSTQQVIFDKKEQLEKIQGWILPGETLLQFMFAGGLALVLSASPTDGSYSTTSSSCPK
jgi:hypothetical protein